jgi:SH3 domain protein
MRWLSLTVAGICLLCAGVSASAETWYITDSVEITLRTGPGIDHKIIAMLRSGQPLEVVEPGEEWTEIVTPAGTTGWVLNRFLSATPPARLELDGLRERYKTVTLQAADLQDENNRLKAENRQMQTELEQDAKKLAALQQTYDTLKSESADFFTLKSKYKKAAAGLAQISEKAKRLETEVQELQFNKNIRWFLTGAGVLVFGFIIGFSAKRQRRRSSLL